MISHMETLAEFFDRTKHTAPRSLERLGHHRLAPVSKSSPSSTAESMRTTESQEHSRLISERRSSAV